MQRLIILAFIGFVAQLIDGSLGMAYGVTSTSLLLMFGIAPAVASASVHIAEVVTTAAAGVSHWKFGNIDKIVVKRLMIPGSIGAFTGACFLSSLKGEAVKPFISAFLFLLGFYVIYRFLFMGSVRKKHTGKPGTWAIPLGLFAGFFDSTGGGGWGPLTTPVLLSHKGMEARKVIGSVDTSEFAIAVSASLGFLISLGFQDIDWLWVGVLMIGGIVAAPIAAWFVRVIPSYLLGVLVGGLIITTNTQTLLSTVDIIPEIWHYAVYGSLSVFWLSCLAWAIRKKKSERDKS
ncbi:sulfite exporter TauE/SafE family protein [Melghirimyces algeriensis]|uniref:Probable membrane transporter protein n=1 Tax=Melghirimyces algeriensis TaxID=910412 RepID=A0A521DY51_9BACL|nr:sulfite exporter TauE/SafE family protein [Melghirimyces algeriensis]SMO75820.1 hypothetical protein SAMN06264849_10729 [Melghirimyces algeriensis]